MIFTEEQLENASIDLTRNDVSKLDPKNILTSDQALYEISTIKETVTREILHNIKEASIDCNIHLKPGNKEKLKCLTSGTLDSSKFAFAPSIADEDFDKAQEVNKEAVELKLKKLKIPGVGPVAVNMANVGPDTGKIEAEVYTLESAQNKNPVQIGKLKFENGKPQMPFIPL